MKSLFLGILVIIVVGIGGLLYRNVVESPLRQQIACPQDALVCPDGTSVSRTGLACSFPACPPPNVSIPEINVSFALPAGFVSAIAQDASVVATYELPATGSSTSAAISIRRYPIMASSTALETIQKTAIGAATGEPVNPTLFSSTLIGSHRYTVVSIERFEGTINTAYYLTRGIDVLRFDAIDREADWTNPALDVKKLPAHSALEGMLKTLKGQ